MKILSIVGARPQFIKCAPIRAGIAARDGLSEVLVHTGQHYDFEMSEVFFRELDIAPPEHFLGLGGGSHGAMTGRMLEGLEEVMQAEAPAAVMVYGDTNSTLAGALAASKMGIPVLHVEAGLRSFNRAMPEEINRVLTDHVSSLLFCPTQEAEQNLRNEGITAGVHQVGDLMYDVALSVQRLLDADAIRAEFAPGDRTLATCTIHRAENTGDPARLAEVVAFVRSFADSHTVVLPLHPGTRARIEQAGVSLDGLTVVDPLPYLKMQGLLAASDLVLTDSGGLQKEAYFHRTDCITLRDETEWTETVEAGWNRLWTDPVRRAKRPILAYGDGHSADAILNAVEAWGGRRAVA